MGRSMAVSADQRRVTASPAPRLFQIACHESERFLFAEFALAQLRDCRGVARVAGQVIAADAFDGYDFAGGQHFGGAADGFPVAGDVSARMRRK